MQHLEEQGVDPERDDLAELTAHGHGAAVEHQRHGTQRDAHAEHESHQAHGDHHRTMIADFRRRFWVCLVLTVPILLLAPTIQDWLGLDWDFPGEIYLLFALSTAVYFYGGWPFLTGGIAELGKRAPGMMTLIALGISAAYLYSSAVVFGLAGKTFFWELATLVDVMLVGHWIEMRSVLGASKALEALAALMPSNAW